MPIEPQDCGIELQGMAVPTPTGTKIITVRTSEPIFIVGKNGTGKSALVHFLSAQIRGSIFAIRYMPGSRPIYFDDESSSLTPAGRRNLDVNFKTWDASPDARWRSISGTSRNEMAIHDLLSAEVQYKINIANAVARDGPDSQAIALAQTRSSPADRVN